MLEDIQTMVDSAAPKVEPSGAKMTEAKLLSECGSLLVIDGTPGEQYQISIDSGNYLIVCAGATVGKASSHFSHPNVAASCKRIFEFKHYHKDGGKSWTEQAGVDHYFVIPRSAIKLLPEKGYSYIPAEINGVKVSFNVSGGSVNGWTDYLYCIAHIRVNHKVADLKKLAEVAVRNSPFEPIAVQPLNDVEMIRWKRMASRLTKGLVEKIGRLADENKSPVVKLLPGYQVCGEDIRTGKIIEVSRRVKKVKVDPDPGYDAAYRTEYTGAVKDLFASFDNSGYGRTRVKLHQVDWYETAIANGLSA